MEPMRSSRGPARLVEETAADDVLLALARASLAHGLRYGTPLTVYPRDLEPAHRRDAACFVTLRRAGALRGCVGVLEPRAPLGVAVAETAFRAAFEDPRFEPLRAEELIDLDVHISILGPRERLAVRSEEELLRVLRPGVDGLVLDAECRTGTLLPAVWAELPDARSFVGALKGKIGLPEDAWSPAWRCERFAVRELG